MWTKQEGEGGPGSFHHLRDPHTSGQQGQGEAHSPGGAGRTGWRPFRDGCVPSVTPLIRPPSPIQPQSTPNPAEVPWLGVGNSETEAGSGPAVKRPQTSYGEERLTGRQLMNDTGVS